MLGVRLARAVFVAAIMFGFTSSAFAQTQVRVTRESAIIWGREARVPITTVRIGTILDVVGRDGAWYVVVVPPENGGHGEVGIIAVSQVEPVAGTPQPAPRTPASPPTGGAAAHPPKTSAGATGHHPPTEVFGFGEFGYTSFTFAHDTFNAIFGTQGMPGFGGGVRVHFLGRWFLDASIDRIEKTGQRVVVVGGDTFPLGIGDTVRLLPVAVNVGYRHQGRQLTPYVGGGVGVVFYDETSQFADPSENVSDRFVSYQGVGGLEVGSHRGIVRLAIEGRFSTVPGAIGGAGASAAFNEHNLGGPQIWIKVLVGH